MRLLIILIVFMATKCLGQTNNDIILSYVENSIGKRVGGGVCRELPAKAIKEINPLWNLNQWYGKKIRLKRNARPGDFILFKDIMVDGYYAECHIAVLYKILEDGTYIIAQQNVQDKKNFITRRDSKVILSHIKSLKTRKGKIIVYRYK